MQLSAFAQQTSINKYVIINLAYIQNAAANAVLASIKHVES